VIRKSLTSIIIDSDALIHILPHLTPDKIESIRAHLAREHQISLSELVDKKGGPWSSLRDLSRAILLGPLEFDVWLLNRAMEGVGTKEKYLNLVLLSRKNGDVEAVRDAYWRRYRRSLADDIRKELRGMWTLT
jgi:annexin A7/11